MTLMSGDRKTLKYKTIDILKEVQREKDTLHKFACQREGKRERDKERERERYREIDIEKERERERERERKKEREIKVDGQKRD